MNEYVGSCLCGATAFKVRGEIEEFYLCHCQRCQKDTGSAYAANLFVKTGMLTWLTGAQTVTTFSLPATRYTKSFCTVCGSAMPNTEVDGVIVIPAGCLDNNLSIIPTAHICTSWRASWDRELRELPQFKALPE